MDVSEVVKRRDHLQRDINDLIRKFVEETHTGLVIDVNAIEVIGKPSRPYVHLTAIIQ